MERRREGVLIFSDIKAAFDCCWWSRIKVRLKGKSMAKRSVRLMRSFFYKGFLKVVASGKVSSVKGMFSGVPRGGIWSPSLWDFDISETTDGLSDSVLFFGYANDVAL